MRFIGGMAVGTVVGAAAMYLVQAAPWRSATTPAEGPVEVAPLEPAPTPRGKARPRRANVARGGDAKGPTQEAMPAVPDRDLTSAERALTWRGDRIELAPVALDLGSDVEARPLSSDEIQRGVERMSGSLQRCLADAVLGVTWAGDLTVELGVRGDGTISGVRVQAPAYLQDQGLLACVRTASRRAGFAATGQPTRVTVPLSLS